MNKFPALVFTAFSLFTCSLARAKNQTLDDVKVAVVEGYYSEEDHDVMMEVMEEKYTEEEYAAMMEAMEDRDMHFEEENYPEDQDPIRAKYFESCMSGDTKDIAESLEVHPDLINELNVYGLSCLMMAGVPYSDEGDYSFVEPFELVKMLVEAGADVNLRASEMSLRMPAIAHHIQNFHYKTIEYLIENGADVNIVFDGYPREDDEEDAFSDVKYTPLDLYTVMLQEGGLYMFPKDVHEAVGKTEEVLLKHDAKRFVGSDEL